MQKLAYLGAIGAFALLAGCWNGDNVALRLGDVSLGRQLIDLKSALDEGAMSEEEYTRVRAALMATADACGANDANAD